ncbi:hypothetical protein TVAG_377850 [Trichomonas vaginalis G3]|uniref:Proteasome assembly chaperone 2 n=1 Tax=Trichomonas vaginalis (strain ATCC PRA-98 / G3) TaxID=412133 RepID=A2DAX6_TRIV3|nr:proteasome assembly chaperone 2 family [Trichomonas vaginalis G3]EAY22306.1 hypothetical protein TVAG_377850 [Trichomonas vaginalis G3]KAI5518244.1 proteasome assembly chaperone 2 family [Trichomonas vaginalis G3]|eukprot:XP_001583292.1 hypothetical protein [Trichomonas vaginalis G3]
MKFVPIGENSLEGRILVVPSCGSGSVDQLTVDLICYKFGKLVGRFISNNVDMVVTPDPYKKEGGELATAVDVYIGETPLLGPIALLRIASSIPKQKRKILEFSKEIAHFAQENKIKDVLFVRTVSSVFCLEQQIRDWPFALRATGKLAPKIKFNQIEDYTEVQAMLKNTVFGDLYNCLQKQPEIDLSAAFFFVHEGRGFNEAVFFAKKLTNEENIEIPYSWELLME